MTTGWP